MISFENALEPSSWAAAALGPKQSTPAARRASPSPATSGASGPITTRSTPSASAAATSASTSSDATSISRASPAIPALPGAHNSSGERGERARACTRACSRPPAPTTSTRGRPGEPPPRRPRASDGANEVVDRDRRQSLEARRAARAELKRYAGHRGLVGRLHDVDEIEAAERRPLRLHGRAELLELAIDFLDPHRVVLDRLNSVWRQRRKHDVRRHFDLLIEPDGAPLVPDRGGSGPRDPGLTLSGSDGRGRARRA